jgi:hypothetical protein
MPPGIVTPVTTTDCPEGIQTVGIRFTDFAGDTDSFDPELLTRASLSLVSTSLLDGDGFEAAIRRLPTWTFLAIHNNPHSPAIVNINVENPKESSPGGGPATATGFADGESAAADWIGRNGVRRNSLRRPIQGRQIIIDDRQLRVAANQNLVTRFRFSAIEARGTGRDW